ncbi:ComEA family DNA-binding protein [Persephonella sp.]
MSINTELLNLQKKTVLTLILIILFMKYFFENSYSRSVTEANDLRININTASLEDLKKIPYIGEKTGEKIIKLREETGHFSSIEQLKNIRNYKKFKNYIKVE